MSGTQRERPFEAIAAMSLNRVIGNGKEIPWRIPEDFQWFKSKTLGHAVVMGRKTLECIGRPLPNRQHLVLTRQPQKLLKERSKVFGGFKEWIGQEEKRSAGENGDLLLFSSIDILIHFSSQYNRRVFVCGGAEVYRQLLSSCSDLYLTRVNHKAKGDSFFPYFEDRFDLKKVMQERETFRIEHWSHKMQTGEGFFPRVVGN